MLTGDRVEAECGIVENDEFGPVGEGERQTEASLAEGLVLPRPNRTPPSTSVASILEHLFQHQIHHRGQAHAMLSSTPVKPPQLDEFFLAGEEPLRRDELRALGLPET